MFIFLFNWGRKLLYFILILSEVSLNAAKSEIKFFLFPFDCLLDASLILTCKDLKLFSEGSKHLTYFLWLKFSKVFVVRYALATLSQWSFKERQANFTLKRVKEIFNGHDVFLMMVEMLRIVMFALLTHKSTVSTMTVGADIKYREPMIPTDEVLFIHFIDKFRI